MKTLTQWTALKRFDQKAQQLNDWLARDHASKDYLQQARQYHSKDWEWSGSGLVVAGLGALAARALGWL